MTIPSLTFNEPAWQYACDKPNAAAKAAHESAQMSKPEGERVAFVPVALPDYIAARMANIEASYLAQQSAEHLAIIAAQDPASLARLAKAAALPEGPTRDALAAQVDAL